MGVGGLPKFTRQWHPGLLCRTTASLPRNTCRSQSAEEDSCCVLVSSHRSGHLWANLHGDSNWLARKRAAVWNECFSHSGTLPLHCTLLFTARSVTDSNRNMPSVSLLFVTFATLHPQKSRIPRFFLHYLFIVIPKLNTISFHLSVNNYFSQAISSNTLLFNI